MSCGLPGGREWDSVKGAEEGGEVGFKLQVRIVANQKRYVAGRCRDCEMIKYLVVLIFDLLRSKSRTYMHLLRPLPPSMIQQHAE